MCLLNYLLTYLLTYLLIIAALKIEVNILE